MPSNEDGATMLEARSIKSWTKLGAAVRDARIDRGLTQADAAAQAGVARSWLARVEAGHRGAELQSLLKLFAALGLEMTIQSVLLAHPPPPLTRREQRSRGRTQDSQRSDLHSGGAPVS